MVGISTSREVWAALERHYASKSRARIMQLRRELQTIRKGSQTMQHYFLKAKQLADSLASSGHPIETSDLQQIILAGLDSAYDAIVTTLTTTVTDSSMDDFYAHLLAFDMRVEAQIIALQQNPVANVATQQRNSSSKSYSNQFSPQPRSYHNQSGYRNQNSGRTRSRNPATMPRPHLNTSGPCQLCGRKNHVAATCWHRFDKEFHHHASHTPPAAYIAAPGSFNNKWIPDSGATNHLTSDFANLHVSSPYEGPDQIRVGNGDNLHIENIGSTFFFHNSRKFHLKTLYHVPNISANLLSVSQFSRDNNCFFEFHPTFFVVKDCSTARVLLRGTNKGGLYQFDDVSSPQSTKFALLSASLPVWHQRLGHPMLRTVNKVIKNNSLLVSNRTTSFCNSCHMSKNCKLPFSPSFTTCNEPLSLIVSDL